MPVRFFRTNARSRSGHGGQATAAIQQSEQNLPQTAALLRLENVKKSYGSSLAVDDTSFSLGAGEILTLLGPSGCGKTTTLRIAIGLDRTDTGRVWFNGQCVDSPQDRIFIPPEKRNMGMVFQSYAIWPHMTVFENVAYPLRARRFSPDKIQAEVAKVLDLVGLQALAQRPGTRLSGGQQQRVAIARALAFGPGLLLMDEPFSNLDSRLRTQMRSEVKLLQRRLGIAVLFVTHDQSEALALSDRIAVMRAGRIEQIGRSTELYAFPQTPAVRDFLGMTVLLRGRIARRDNVTSVLVELDDGVTCVVAGPDHTAGAQAHSRCLVAIRPEQVRVEIESGAPHDAQPANNVIRGGAILTLLFMGDRYEAGVRLPSGEVITVMLPATADWQEGSAVRLTLPETQLQLWLAEEPAL